MVSYQEMTLQLAALQRQRDQALYQVVLAEARMGMLEAELDALRKMAEEALTKPRAYLKRKKFLRRRKLKAVQ